MYQHRLTTNVASGGASESNAIRDSNVNRRHPKSFISGEGGYCAYRHSSVHTCACADPHGSIPGYTSPDPNVCTSGYIGPYPHRYG
ncbi:MAG: hypothetical protein BZY88_07360 [SAR202 cluster bacterium Io17-Chloro-G9]|nr:MAG: hypothetical protein BZY88_07360 [SAR202 cluster bacterium Io17-Chloro-G9]